MRVFIFGANGMLGNYVHTYFKANTEFDVVGITRKEIDLSDITNFSLLDNAFKKDDVVINCVGVIKQRNNAEDLDFIIVNSAFPHYVNNVCKNVGARFINISTDCVFSGFDGDYNEESLHDAEDIYGRTKSLGEPSDATTVRTSIIGEEKNNFCSLIEWVKGNRDKKVNGFTNHLWNGITCLQFAKVCEYIITKDYYWEGVRHIFSPRYITKYELVKLISKVYDLNISVIPFAADVFCDRTLQSIYESSIDIPELEVQIKEQKEFY